MKNLKLKLIRQKIDKLDEIIELNKNQNEFGNWSIKTKKI